MTYFDGVPLGRLEDESGVKKGHEQNIKALRHTSGDLDSRPLL